HPVDRRAQLRLQPPPDAVGLHHERDLERVAALLADEPPVAPRLLARHLAPLQEERRESPAGGGVGGGAPDDPAADDHDICFCCFCHLCFCHLPPTPPPPPTGGRGAGRFLR